MFISIRRSKFMENKTNLGSSLEAQFTLTGKRFLKWGHGGLEGERKCYDEKCLPQGWVLAYDFDLRSTNKFYKLTLHAPKDVYAFKSYLQQLSKIDCRLEDVVTRITMVSTRKWNFAPQFEIVSDDECL